MPGDDKKTNPNKPGKPEDKLKVEAKEVNDGRVEEDKLSGDPDVKKAAEESVSGIDEKLQTPGGLEVEEMPESGELQERRKKTKNLLKETVPTDEELSDGFDEDDDGIMDLLREANLSPRHLRFCCGGVFVVFLIGALIWGGIVLAPKVFDIFGGEDSDVVEEVDDSDGEDVDDAELDGEDTEDGDSAAGDFDYEGFEEEYGFLDISVYTGVLIGEEVTEQDDATSAGEELGEELVADDSFAMSIYEFGEMYEAMQVDVQDLLDGSNERQETLDDYQHELNYLLYVGKKNLDELKQANEYIVEKFTEIELERDENEVRFFDKMRELDAYGSSAALNDFIVDAEEVVYLRAQYNARVKLISYYEEVLVAMEARVTDIELNEEALVKGVQVVDISGSDIDLIIDESEL